MKGYTCNFHVNTILFDYPFTMFCYDVINIAVYLIWIKEIFFKCASFLTATAEDQIHKTDDVIIPPVLFPMRET